MFHKFQEKKTEIDRLCEKNDINFLGVFGSVARGDDTPTSDIDLLVRFGKPKGLFALAHMERELEQLLQKRIDLVTENSVSPYIRQRIIEQTKPIYERA